MKKLIVLIICNFIVLGACAVEAYNEFKEGFTGVKAHHGLMLYMLAELVIRIKEVVETAEKMKRVKHSAEAA